MAFFQDPPRLKNQFDDDLLLREYLARTLPTDVFDEIEGDLRDAGERAAGEYYDLQVRDRENLPRLTQWDAWGRRVDQIEVTPLWREARRFAAERGLVAIAYERKYGAHSRIYQFALNYLVEQSFDVYSCPLAMTDGAAAALVASRNKPLIERAVARLTSRDPSFVWTSGQWMTERTGGSDVGLTETIARETDGVWRLYGTKWFSSATTSEMALTLARPEGNASGGKGLALFYLETRDAEGRLNGIAINRLKDKLGTRKVPTAELTLDGAVATPVGELSDGVKAIAPMLNVTRTWNAIGAISGMRRALALAWDYAGRRVAFGSPLGDKPLHRETLYDLDAEFEGAFFLTFRIVELLGRADAKRATDNERSLLRCLTPIAKLTTAKQAVAVASEALESFGGAGYVEDTGLPRLLRDAQVLPIWEGTTNVLALDVLRAIEREGLGPLREEIEQRLTEVTSTHFAGALATLRARIEQVRDWYLAHRDTRDGLEAGARRFALRLGRLLETAYVLEHGQWCLDVGRRTRALDVADRLQRQLF